MDADDVWARQRGRLLGIAYRMLGSISEAEDAVQDTWLRWEAADRAAIREPAAWLTTVVTRRCLDLLRAARTRRETYVGPWLPEPVVTAPDVADHVELVESLQMALLVVLETLSPLERAVFVLRDVFGYEYDEVAEAVGRSPAACRQLAHRAREHVASRRPRFDPDPEARRRVAERFVVACATGDLEGLIATLAEDVTLWADGGGIVRAARRPVTGATKVARLLLGILADAPADVTTRFVELNAEPGVILDVDGVAYAAVILQTADDVVTDVRIVVNPPKLAALPPP